MKRSVRLSRRTVLRDGDGRCPALAGGDGTRGGAGRGDAARGAIPRADRRSSTCPTASTWPTGRPRTTGPSFRLPPTLRPLEPFRQDLLVLSGLGSRTRRRWATRAATTPRSLACFLTGTHPLKTDGANIRAGVSIDQVAAAPDRPSHAAAVARAGDRPLGTGGKLRLGL